MRRDIIHLAQCRKRRFFIFIFGVCILPFVVSLVFFALRDTINFFRIPSEINDLDRRSHAILRLGGYVEKGTVQWDAEAGIRFRVTDMHRSQEVRFNGILPDLFREEQGVIVEGSFDTSGVFVARRVLAKHGENYMPKDLVDRLKVQGLWEDYLNHDH
ncbi:MAG: cytochrome c-type biogenesis protein CcmE [Candidatus Tokpelaia sp. JSC189]|nr:MAG: cytochrome c-type biogenesis protein CcmE [Candidatus Tokpelaia sp. JSC189]